MRVTTLIPEHPIPGDSNRRRPGRWLWRLAFCVAVLGTLSIVFRKPWFGGNYGVVEVAKVYRSAQPREGLRELIRAKNLGSILNLRGGSWIDPWYADEVGAARDAEVEFYDFPISATRRPSRRELLVLLDLFERCRYPLLIHCRSGSDRTGLVSALYLMAKRGEPPTAALRSFTVEYGHVPVFGPEHLHEPIDEYAAWLASRKLTHTPDRLRGWVETEYGSDEPRVVFRPLRAGPREPHSRQARSTVEPPPSRQR